METMTEKEIILGAINSFEKQEKISSIGLRFLHFVGSHYGRANATDGVFISENKEIIDTVLQPEISKLVSNGYIELHEEQHNPKEKAYRLLLKSDTLYTKISGIIQEEKDKITNARFDKLALYSKWNQLLTLLLSAVTLFVVYLQYVASKDSNAIQTKQLLQQTSTDSTKALNQPCDTTYIYVLGNVKIDSSKSIRNRAKN
jgi:hypothetical protein